MHQELLKALNDAEFLVRDLADARRVACQENPIAEILIGELHAQAVEMRSRLAQMTSLLEKEEA